MARRAGGHKQFLSALLLYYIVFRRFLSNGKRHIPSTVYRRHYYQQKTGRRSRLKTGRPGKTPCLYRGRTRRPYREYIISQQNMVAVFMKTGTPYFHRYADLCPYATLSKSKKKQHRKATPKTFQCCLKLNPARLPMCREPSSP